MIDRTAAITVRLSLTVLTIASLIAVTAVRRLVTLPLLERERRPLRNLVLSFLVAGWLATLTALTLITR